MSAVTSPPPAPGRTNLADSLTARASAFVSRRSSRRGFLARSALVGSALTASGTTYLLKPTSAYAATCRCLGRTCNCNDLCCDGYTEFCCHIYGQNSCPPNTILAGWWKVDNSGYCDGAARYYMDCNKRVSCGCGSSGVCRDGSTTCRCRACGNRKDGCTLFRYGNCNNQVRCVGPIMCRVVTCTKPWEIDPGCSTASRTDNNTRFHHRPCLEEPVREPTDAERSLVRAFYADYLGRSASSNEVEFWAEKLAAGRTARQVSDDFARTDEYIGRFIDDLYQSVFGRPADASGKQNWTNQIKDGMLPSEVAARLYGSTEFFNRVGGTVEAYVDAMYQEILGREPDESGRQHWINHIEAGNPRRTVARQFYGSVESRHRRVRGLYQRFLRRGVDDSGLQTWTEKLGTNGGDDLELATFLTASQEYQAKAEQRFPDGGPAPTTTTTSTTSTSTTSTTSTSTTSTSTTSSSTTTTEAP